MCRKKSNVLLICIFLVGKFLLFFVYVVVVFVSLCWLFKGFEVFIVVVLSFVMKDVFWVVEF